MGAVYRAWDARLGRDVAVKVLPAGALADTDAVARFEREARAVGALNHAAVVAVFDVGDHDGLHYVVSELLEGETLRKRMAGSPLTVRKALDYAIQIAHGLAAAHEKRIVHRDLKPENLFVTRDGQVKILDFGLAKLAPTFLGGYESTGSLSDYSHITDPGTVMGTIGYMAPEQLQGRPVDVRSDIFSYGAVLYEMLAGRRAFRGENPAETMDAILKRDPTELSQIRPEVTPGLERIVARCLEKRPEERFQSARDVAFAFEALSAGSGTGRRFIGPSRRWRRRAATGLVLAVVLGGAFLAGRLTTPVPVPVFQRLSLERGPIRAARFRPDGRVVYSVSRGGGPFRVFSTKPGAPGPQPLDLPAGTVLGVSPAGEMAVLLGQAADPSGTLARVPATGGSPQALSHQVVDAGWAPNGRLCVLRTLHGGQQLEFPPGQVLYRPPRPIHSPRVSPKGDRIAFSNGEGIQVIDIAGTNLVTLTSQPSPVSGLAWSPQGDEVWFTAGETASRALHAVSLVGTSRLVYRLLGETTLEDISADGRLLLTQGFEHKGIAILAPGAVRERELAGYTRPRVAALSSDGRTLLIHEEADRAGHGDAVYLQRTDGSPPVRLGEGRALDLSPDGSRALVVVPGSPSRLVVLPTAGGAATSVPLDRLIPVAGRWLPDGARLVVLAREPGADLRPFLVDPVSGPRALTPESLAPLDSSPDRRALGAVSPDGRLVALSGPGSRVVLLDLEHGELREISGLEAATPVRWTADGHALYVRATDVIRGRLFRVDPTSGQKETSLELLPSDPEGVTLVDTVELTPDGQSYAYTYSRQLLDLYLVEGLR
jgi:dipeptidyl aminopeptidase/acylaminoacyl peptidase